MKKSVQMWMAILALGSLAVAATPALAQQRVVVEERSAVVLKKVGTTVIVRNDKGEIKQYSNLPPDFTLSIDGKPATLDDLREGMTVQAIRFGNVPPPSTITQAQVDQMSSSAPAAAPAAASSTSAAAPAAAPAAAASLPPTGSAWPAVAALGALLLLAGVGLGRRAEQ
jgi:hypothetical protein